MRTTFVAFVLLGFALTADAQETAPNKVPLQVTPPQSGHEMYVAYCASCHGRDGKGSGPVAPALKVAPPDLTQLAKKNDGRFPAARVANVIGQGVSVAAHGSSEMPTWGQLFLSLDQHDDLVIRQRVLSLTRYLRSLQEK